MTASSYVLRSSTRQVQAMRSRLFSTSKYLYHENPLGLPRSGAPPQIPRIQHGLPEKRSIRGVKKVVAVSSAKGGVGKSTIAVNTSLSLARQGLRAGILDTDIFGPSIPTLLHISGEPRLSSKNQLLPLTNYGVKAMSMGFLVGEDAPVVWRGLMVMKALQQLLHEVDWGGLDVLVLDLPPGTGDVQLTITQQVNVDGAVIVSTPQDLALKDAIRGVNMFKKVNIPLIGMVQNMSTFICPACHTKTDIFGGGGGSSSSSSHGSHSSGDLTQKCEKLGLPIIGNVPLDARICADADRGKPTVVAEGGNDSTEPAAASRDSERKKAFDGIAEKVKEFLNV